MRKQQPFLVREVLRAILQRPSEVTEHWALRDLSFEIQPGESVGVIGHNGAGKSTMLSLIAQTCYPNSGTVDVVGRVGPLLELGAGFHPDLTGNENILLNSMLLGLTQEEAKERFSSIAAYSELGEFLEAPIQIYSTGMRARLGFAVVAHMEADVILLDEILGVGDKHFRHKCQATLADMYDSGQTVILVSHQLASIRKLCRRVLWIDSSRLVMDDQPRRFWPRTRRTTTKADRQCRPHPRRRARDHAVKSALPSPLANDEAVVDFGEPPLNPGRSAQRHPVCEPKHRTAPALFEP